MPGWFGPHWRVMGTVRLALPCLVLFPSLRRNLFPEFVPWHLWRWARCRRSLLPPGRDGHSASQTLEIATGSLRRSLGEKRQLSACVEYVGCHCFFEDLTENRRKTENPLGSEIILVLPFTGRMRKGNRAPLWGANPGKDAQGKSTSRRKTFPSGLTLLSPTSLLPLPSRTRAVWGQQRVPPPRAPSVSVPWPQALAAQRLFGWDTHTHDTGFIPFNSFCLFPGVCPEG